MSESNTEAPLPGGLVALPELGPDVVGTRLRPGAVTGRWVIAVTAAVCAGLVAGSGLPAFAGSWSGLGFIVLMVLGLGTIAGYHVRLARVGRTPVLLIDADTVHVGEPFNKVEIDLGAITRVRVLSRDLLVEAPGGITRRARLTNARWAPINHAKSFEVTPKGLADYLTSRAEAARD
jgi:hypothetical protein